MPRNKNNNKNIVCNDRRNQANRQNIQTDKQIERFKRKSLAAINCLNSINAQTILEQPNIKAKYHIIADKISMGRDVNSRYAYFISIKNEKFFQLRFADHSSFGEDIYAAKERGRKPDFRCHILFERKTIVPTPIDIPNVSGVPIIGVSLPWNILDTEHNINLLIGALIQLLQTGKFICPKFIFNNVTDKADEQTMVSNSQPNPSNNLKEHTIYNKNKIKLRNNMKRTIRLTEGDLRRLVEGALSKLDMKSLRQDFEGEYDWDDVDKKSEMDYGWNDYDNWAARERSMYEKKPLHYRYGDGEASLLSQGDGPFSNFGRNLTDLDKTPYPFSDGRSMVKRNTKDESRNRNLVNRITESIIRKLGR